MFVLVPQCRKVSNGQYAMGNTQATFRPTCQNRWPQSINSWMRSAQLSDRSIANLPDGHFDGRLRNLGSCHEDSATLRGRRPVCGGSDPRLHAKSSRDCRSGLPWRQRPPCLPPIRDMIQALKDIGEKPIYTELKNTGHDAWTPAINNPELIQWLFKQHK